MDEKMCVPCEEPITDKITPCPLQCMSPKCVSYMKKPPLSLAHKPIVWVFGGPGCSKTNHCVNIANKYNFHRISIGHMIRAEANSKSIRCRCLTSILTRGAMAPNDLVLNLIRNQMDDNRDAAGYLIEGFPRDRAQGAAFEKRIGPVTVIIYLEIPAQELHKRLEVRAKVQPERLRLDDNLDTINLKMINFLEGVPKILDMWPHKLFKIRMSTAIEEFNEITNVLTPAVKKLADEAEEERMAKQRDIQEEKEMRAKWEAKLVKNLGPSGYVSPESNN